MGNQSGEHAIAGHGNEHVERIPRADEEDRDSGNDQDRVQGVERGPEKHNGARRPDAEQPEPHQKRDGVDRRNRLHVFLGDVV